MCWWRRISREKNGCSLNFRITLTLLRINNHIYGQRGILLPGDILFCCFCINFYLFLCICYFPNLPLRCCKFHFIFTQVDRNRVTTCGAVLSWQINSVNLKYAAASFKEFTFWEIVIFIKISLYLCNANFQFT